MENNGHITTYLNEYIKMPDPRYAVLLKGKWGSGKTFFIQKLIEEWNLKSDTSDDKIVLKPIYISLYGVSSVKTITEKIKSILNPFLYSKGAKAIKKILIGTVKLTAKIDLDIGGDQDDDSFFSFDLNTLNLLTEKNDKISGDKILVFDDFERCKIPIDELFGYINNFVEHNQCKVILIADEDKIDKKNNFNGLTYNDFKEKLIGQTFEVFPDYRRAINFFLENTNSNSLNSNFDIIYDVFLASRTDNLRILRQCFYDFCRLEELIDEKIKEYPKYNDFIKELLCYFIIFYCEYKNGNTKIELYQKFEYNSNMTVEEHKKIQSIYGGKYLSIQRRNRFNFLFYTLRGEPIVDFIEKRNLDKSFLNKTLKGTVFFSESNKISRNKLKNFFLLSNSEFSDIYGQVKSDFENQEINDITELLDICGILLFLNENNITSYDSKKIIQIAKKNIDRFFSENTYEIKRRSEDDIYIYYFSCDTPEFIEINNYYLDQIKDQVAKIGKSYLKDYFENLDDFSINFIYQKMNEFIPYYDTKYNFTSIFKPINIKIFAEKITQLSNSSKDLFIDFFRMRYLLNPFVGTPKMCDYHKGDLDSLIKLQSILNKKNKSTKSIDKYVLTYVVKTINEAIETINSSEIKDENPSYW